MRRRWAIWRIRPRIDAWVLRRIRPEVEAVISRRRVYIVPTRFGFGFAVMTIVMLLGATNYSNSMAFLLGFLIAALGLVCMHHTHANLLNVRVRAGRTAAVHAGDTLRFEIVLDNPTQKTRYDLQLSRHRRPVVAVHDVTAGVPIRASLAVAATRRGWQRNTVFRISTEFPLGLFYAWTLIELDQVALVYPRAADAASSPPSAGNDAGELTRNSDGHDEFDGLRAYRPGDSPRRLHWKSLGKRQPPSVRVFSDTASPERWLDWDALPGLDTEQRLSQLTRWVLDAEAAQQRYGLRLPSQRIDLDRGEVHQQRCLSALALYGTNPTR